MQGYVVFEGIHTTAVLWNMRGWLSDNEHRALRGLVTPMLADVGKLQINYELNMEAHSWASEHIYCVWSTSKLKVHLLRCSWRPKTFFFLITNTIEFVINKKKKVWPLYINIYDVYDKIDVLLTSLHLKYYWIVLNWYQIGIYLGDGIFAFTLPAHFVINIQIRHEAKTAFIQCVHLHFA